MPVSGLSAARSLCEMRDWRVSNLEIQKILYLAQMFHLGQHEIPLLNEGFEAWDYGPVVPVVYGRVRGFGSAPVRNVFNGVAPVQAGTPEYDILAEAERVTRDISPGQLVKITHLPNGAWANNYVAGRRHTAIPNGDILDEYRLRRTRQRAN